MAIYVPKYNGYIVDNPNIDFIRCDGKVYNYDEVSTAGFSDTSNSLTITGGRSRSPLAYIDTDRNIEFTFTSALFTLEMFEMANAENIIMEDAHTLETKLFTVGESEETFTVVDEEENETSFSGTAYPIVELPYLVDPASVKVRGFVYQKDPTHGTNIVGPASGKYLVLVSKWEEDNGVPIYYNYIPELEGNEEFTTYVLFNEDNDVEGDVRVSYKRRVVNASVVMVQTDDLTARGSLTAHYPVYSNGSDCSEENLKGWLHICLYKVMITALPGFDTSYKSAQTNSITVSSIDPKRPDKKVYDITYEELGENGRIVNKTNAFGPNLFNTVAGTATSNGVTFTADNNNKVTASFTLAGITGEATYSPDNFATTAALVQEGKKYFVKGAPVALGGGYDCNIVVNTGSSGYYFGQGGGFFVAKETTEIYLMVRKLGSSSDASQKSAVFNLVLQEAADWENQ